jgi:hypothetical protein
MPKSDGDMTAGEIIRTALIWAEESMNAMIGGLHKDDPHRAEVLAELRQLRAYHKRRFGEVPNPLAGCKLVDIREIKNAPR